MAVIWDLSLKMGYFNSNKYAYINVTNQLFNVLLINKVDTDILSWHRDKLMLNFVYNSSSKKHTLKVIEQGRIDANMIVSIFHNNTLLYALWIVNKLTWFWPWLVKYSKIGEKSLQSPSPLDKGGGGQIQTH